MLKRLSGWLQQVSTGPVALAALVIFLLFTALVMARYPVQTPVVASLAPLFTAAKWVFVIGSCVLLFAGVAIAAWRRIRQTA